MKNEIYIGDNYNILTNDFFKEKYTNKVKMIYIDPPYNTLSDKSYNDKSNSDSWADSIKERILISKDLLKEDGVIFISIDDNEYASLKIVCDKIFGKDNFVGTFITQQAQRSNAKYINTVHEYIICFAKNKKKLQKFEVNRMEIPEDNKMITRLKNEIKEIYDAKGYNIANKEIKHIVNRYCEEYNITWLRNYNNVDEQGRIFFAVDLSTPSTPREVIIPEIGLNLAPLETRGWVSDKRFIELHKQDRLHFKGDRPYSKMYIEEAYDSAPSILKFYSRHGTNDLKKLGLYNLFDTPKPVDLIKFLIRIATKPNDIILDYYAGSGTTAQAVYEVNVEENRKNNYVLIQIDEEINNKTSVYKKCKEIGINPSMKYILKHRIDTFLNQRNMKDDYNFYGEMEKIKNEE